MENLTFKLYSPLTAELLPVDSEFWREDELVELGGHELSAYAAAISEQIEREGDRLEQYLDGEKEPYLAAHVKSIRLSVEEHGGELCGCATVVVDADLTERGWNDLQEYLSGQYSDGWGEGFEQRDIAVEDGSLNVHFWQPERFAFTVEQAQVAPQAELPAAVNNIHPAQPDKKYEITDIAHPVYPELHRIRALRKVSGDVPYGALGGFVQSEANLSQDRDEAWLYNDSVCRDEARVCESARLMGQAMAQDLALVSGGAILFDRAMVGDNAIVKNGCLCDDAVVCGNARVRENVQTHAAPLVSGQAVVMGDLAGKVIVAGHGCILPGQTVDNPTRHMIAISEQNVSIVREPGFAPGRDGKNRNTPER